LRPSRRGDAIALPSRIADQDPSGAFDLTGAGNAFALTGFASFANLVAGTSFGSLGGVLDDGTVGDFAASIVRHASGSNAIGCAGALPDMTFVIRGDVSTVAAVPEPDLLRLAGLAAVAGIAKRRQRRGLVGTAR
jgi:hypothetical protein